VLEFSYTRLNEDASRAEQRTVRPLALAFWSGVWTLAAWDERRIDFRTFRLDRIEQLEVTSRIFTPKRGQRLEDMMKRVRAEAAAAATPSRPASASD
jgi:predicted DNA-binding transcriptional regulator YafY